MLTNVTQNRTVAAQPIKHAHASIQKVLVNADARKVIYTTMERTALA